MKIYLAWCVLVFGVIMAIFTPIIILLHLLGTQMGRYTYYVIHSWAFVYSKLTALFIEVHGQHHLEKGHTYIYVANHNSFLDAIAVAYAIPFHFAPLGKIELTRIPVLGWVFQRILVQVDRSNPVSRKKSIKQLMKVLNQERTSILIFPEGTMNRTQEPLTSFFDGAFRIAIETQKPLVPLVIRNSKKRMPPGGFRISPGHMEVIFQQPIPVADCDLEDIVRLKNEVRAKILTVLRESNHSGLTVNKDIRGVSGQGGQPQWLK